MEGLMPNISSYGLVQESRVLVELVNANKARLEPRGVNDDFRLQYATKVDDMVTKKSATGDVRSDTKQLSNNERDARKELRDDISRVQLGVTKAFPLRSPQRKEFHIGKRINSSTAAILGYAADVRNAYAKYKDELAKTGIIGKDVEALTASAEKLSSVDTKQEIAKKKGSPEATSAFQQAVTDVIAASDFIHTAAAAEFKKEAAIAKQFAQAKKLRFAPEPKKPKPPVPAPGKPEHPAPGN